MGVTMGASAAPRTVLLDDRKVIDMKVRAALQRIGRNRGLHT
jgi:hypothetical protein